MVEGAVVVGGTVVVVVGGGGTSNVTSTGVPRGNVAPAASDAPSTSARTAIPAGSPFTSPIVSPAVSSAAVTWSTVRSARAGTSTRSGPFDNASSTVLPFAT